VAMGAVRRKGMQDTMHVVIMNEMRGRAQLDAPSNQKYLDDSMSWHTIASTKWAHLVFKMLS